MGEPSRRPKLAGHVVPTCLVSTRAHGYGPLQSCRSSLAELMARTSLDLELDLQASRTRQRQLNEEICTLRELRQRLEDAQLRGQTDLPHWVLRDERFRSLLKEAERQVRCPGPGHTVTALCFSASGSQVNISDDKTT